MAERSDVTICSFFVFLICRRLSDGEGSNSKNQIHAFPTSSGSLSSWNVAAVFLRADEVDSFLKRPGLPNLLRSCHNL